MHYTLFLHLYGFIHLYTHTNKYITSRYIYTHTQICILHSLAADTTAPNNTFFLKDLFRNQEYIKLSKILRSRIN